MFTCNELRGLHFTGLTLAPLVPPIPTPFVKQIAILFFIYRQYIFIVRGANKSRIITSQ